MSNSRDERRFSNDGSTLANAIQRYLARRSRERQKSGPRGPTPPATGHGRERKDR